MAWPERGAMLGADVRAAIAGSPLSDLPTELIEALAAGATRQSVAAGSAIHREGDAVPHMKIVVAGLVRIHVSALDGRTLTIRYCRPGSVLGVPTLFAAGFSMPGTIQALVDSELLALRPAMVRSVASRDVRVARVLLGETSERLLAFVAEVAVTAFATVQQRVARHLLDLAANSQRGAELVAPVSQQELADAVGTVREVVVRVLRELRADGVVQTRRHEIVIRDAEQLAGLAWSGGRLLPGWNKGS